MAKTVGTTLGSEQIDAGRLASAEFVNRQQNTGSKTWLWIGGALIAFFVFFNPFKRKRKKR